MYKEHFLGHPLLSLPILAMVLFAIAFVVVVVRAAAAKREDVERLAAMPLADEGGAS